MTRSKHTTKKIDTRVLLSNLWIVVVLNILTADVLSLNIPGAQDVLSDFSARTLPISQLMLVGAVANELAIAMIILSRVLNDGVNRWVNIIVGLFTIAYVWCGGATAYPHYTLIATVETICLLLILWNAWKWSYSKERNYSYFGEGATGEVGTAKGNAIA